MRTLSLMKVEFPAIFAKRPPTTAATGSSPASQGQMSVVIRHNGELTVHNMGGFVFVKDRFGGAEIPGCAQLFSQKTECTL